MMRSLFLRYRDRTGKTLAKNIAGEGGGDQGDAPVRRTQYNVSFRLEGNEGIAVWFGVAIVISSLPSSSTICTRLPLLVMMRFTLFCMISTASAELAAA